VDSAEVKVEGVEREMTDEVKGFLCQSEASEGEGLKRREREKEVHVVLVEGLRVERSSVEVEGEEVREEEGHGGEEMKSAIRQSPVIRHELGEGKEQMTNAGEWKE
jgi:hypothetical protein